GRRYVRLNAGLTACHTTDPALFRAVVLHELAHLRNRDVDQAYLARAIWWSFLALALAPMVLVTVHPRLLATPTRWRLVDFWTKSTLRTGLALLVLTALVYLTRTAILRTREVYADARVSIWEGPGTALREVVSALTPPKGPRWLAFREDHPHP